MPMDSWLPASRTKKNDRGTPMVGSGLSVPAGGGDGLYMVQLNRITCAVILSMVRIIEG